MAHEDVEHFGGGGIAPQPAADAPSDGFEIGLRFLPERAVELGEFLAQRIALPGEHGGFLLTARTAAAEDELFLALAVGMSHPFGFAQGTRSLASRPLCTSLQPAFSKSAASNCRS